MHHLASHSLKSKVSYKFSFPKEVNPSVKWSDVFLQLEFAHVNTRANTENGST